MTDPIPTWSGPRPRPHFTLTRSAEYLDPQELEKQTGRPRRRFARFLTKEVIDNGLDAAETAGRDAFSHEMVGINVTVQPQQGMTNEDGPWVGVLISDAEGFIADIALLAAADDSGMTWTWVIECDGRRKSRPQQTPVHIGPGGPAAEYVTKMFGQHFNQCYERARR